MEFNSFSRLALLLPVVVLSQLPSASAAVGPAPAVMVGKSAIAGSAGEDNANWDRDLFAIFRGEPEPNKGAPAVMVPRKNPPGVGTAVKSLELKEPKLQAIVVADDDRAAAALVNGKIVRPGDQVGGWTVRRISRHGVLLGGPGGEKDYEVLAGRAQARVYSQVIVVPK